jgi:hypothetical protein
MSSALQSLFLLVTAPVLDSTLALYGLVFAISAFKPHSTRDDRERHIPLIMMGSSCPRGAPQQEHEEVIDADNRP